MTPNFFQAATLKKIWVEATLKNSQLTLYKNLYRVLFKPLLRVQIKQAIDFRKFGCQTVSDNFDVVSSSLSFILLHEHSGLSTQPSAQLL